MAEINNWQWLESIFLHSEFVAWCHLVIHIFLNQPHMQILVFFIRPNLSQLQPSQVSV